MSEISYKKLTVWSKSIELVKTTYSLTKELPKSEQFGLSTQMRRAAVSIPSNIAEGYLRGHRTELVRFASIALGSAAELETQLVICRSLDYCQADQIQKAEEQTSEVIRMLLALVRNIKAKSH